jgi:hypothetical protein
MRLRRAVVSPWPIKLTLLLQSLRPLESPVELAFRKTATVRALPASVLARAYRRIQTGSAAVAKFDRLVWQRTRRGYLNG